MADIANLPIIPLMSTTISSSHSQAVIKEIAFKTVPSASKVDIKRVLESFHGLHVQKVRTLNMKGKANHKGVSLVAKPNYKKAYVTLKKPLLLATSTVDNNNNNEMLANQC